jgi:hypothetical protein
MLMVMVMVMVMHLGLELADIRTSVETHLKKNIDEQTWQRALTILIEKELIEIHP